MFLCFAFLGRAQNIIMPYDGSRVDTLHAGSSYTLHDPGGTATYPNSCNSTLKLVSDSGTAIIISGTSHTEYSYDILKIYDGNATSGYLFDTYSGVRIVNDTIRTGVATLVFSSNSSINQSGFSFTVEVCDIGDDEVHGDRVEIMEMMPSESGADPGSYNATLEWDAGTASSWTVSYDISPQGINSTIVTDTPSVVLEGLTALTTYYYSIIAGDAVSGQCIARLRKFRTPCSEARGGCINYSELTSCYVNGSYGTVNNPRAEIGMVNYGSDSILSRHTLHTDTSETDSRTGGQLHTVPPGHISSVRLGNWGVGGEAESITYEYTVDTTVNDLLIMRYAALLQVPNHTASQRPRFNFKILDEEGDEINSGCYSADFIASTNLGWNSFDPYANDSPNHLTDKAVLWKDWTAVGIDLTPFHGRTIFINLSTYDCAHGEHYGYAYFLFDCSDKTITIENCGCQIENTFTAPEGFNYRWYKAEAPDTTLSAGQSLHVTEAGEYRCQLTFVGATEGASCSFEMKAIAGERYPTAIIGIDTTHTSDCNILANLHDNSVISNDSTHLLLTDMPCEGTEWLVDGDFLSAARNCSLVLTPGEHTIQLVSMLAGGSCRDTATQVIEIADLNSDTTVYDTIVENQLPYTFLFQDSGFRFQEPVTDYMFSGSNTNGCDSTIHYNLHVWPNVFCTIDSTICDSELPFSWNNHLFDGDSLFFNSQFSILNSHGADSTVTMILHVNPSSDTAIWDTIVENQLPYTFMDSTFTCAVHSSQFTIHNSQNCDSTILYNLYVWPNVFTTIDSTICDNQLPFTWNNHLFDGDSLIFNSQFSILNSHGADSTVTMILKVNPTSDTTLRDTICDNELPYNWNSHVFAGDSLFFSFHFSVFNSYGCDSTVTMELKVHSTHHIIQEAMICDGAPYLWIDGNTYRSSGSASIGYHNIWGCDSIMYLILSIDSNFKASMEIAPEVVDLEHPEVRLRDRSESHTRQWFLKETVKETDAFSIGTSADAESISLLDDTARYSSFNFPANKDSLIVLLVARTAGGCVDSVWGKVRNERSVIWVPNAFTPSEAENNRFYIISNQLEKGEVWIYNREGLLVTHFDALSGSWDGTYHGIPCPQATYTWIIRYATVGQPRQEHTKRGTVTIIR